MSTQLRLVETTAPTPARRRPTRRARPARPRAARPVRWDSDWRLDPRARRVGRLGVAAAREQLTRASESDLRQAS